MKGHPPVTIICILLNPTGTLVSPLSFYYAATVPSILSAML